MKTVKKTEEEKITLKTLEKWCKGVKHGLSLKTVKISENCEKQRRPVNILKNREKLYSPVKAQWQQR